MKKRKGREQNEEESESREEWIYSLIKQLISTYSVSNSGHKMGKGTILSSKESKALYNQG